MRDLPYFRWWVARAETDENYGSMTDQELGFYHRCLNKSWVNDGLPADQETLSRLMRVSREYLESVWPAVGKCWYEDGARLRNKTQEEERAYALGKSVQSSSAAAARERKKIARSSVDPSVDTSSGYPRAYDSDSVSKSEKGESEGKTLPTLNTQSEYPLVLSEIRAHDPAADEMFVLRLVQETTQHLLSHRTFPQNRIQAATTDKVIATACRESFNTGPRLHGVGLLLKRVPGIIVTWGTEKEAVNGR